MTKPAGEVSQLLQNWRNGDARAGELVVEATYQELRRIARGVMRGERPNHTLQATALVHEAYLRLFQDDPVGVGSRGEFLGLMAAQMKRHLIDHARRRGAEKRGSGAVHKDIDGLEVAMPAGDDSEAFLSRLDAALNKLGGEHPRVAEIIRLRFVGDLSIEDTAKHLKVGSGTVKRDYAFGRAWLMRELGPLE